ncbi:N-acetylneuraminate 9-O-acetyltransferase-like [Rhopilema esculentum]|uniref:N-acetylneuraminate 9-O-acetyltransferase-like n=1 Tax=Rhopilema esculentum TaxID=499914 RepID=UPI0031D81909
MDKSKLKPELPTTTKDEMVKKETIAERITRLMIFGSKILAAIIIIAVFGWHTVRLSFPGSDTCSMLFGSGNWLKDQWKPNGCMMHSYMASEIRTCLRYSQVTFVGDSRMRGLFFNLAGLLSGKKIKNEKAHNNLYYAEPGNISVNFFWQPHANKEMNELFQLWLKEKEKLPQLLIVGAGVWTIKEKSVKAVLGYQENLEKIRQTLSEIGTTIDRQTSSDELSKADTLSQRVKTKRQKHLVKKQWLKVVPQVIWMVQDPVVEAKLNPSRKTITNEKIELFNLAAVKALKSPQIRVLNASSEVAASKPQETSDGLHYSPKVEKVQLDMILNSFCNQYMVPTDASCCIEMEKITKLQFNTFAVFATCVLLWFVMFCLRRCSRCKQDPEPIEQTGLAWMHSDTMYSVLKSMAKLAVIMAYFFVCDRCYVLMKAPKEFSWAAFFVPIGVMVLLGIYKLEKTTDLTLLHGDQSDEWKGWMIFVILVYNYTGAEKILPVYLFIEVLFASYLFIIGFESFMYLWTTGDFGLYRVCKVMARLNVIPVAACLFMDRPYQFYYLTSILSIWFIFLYLMMIFPPRLTAKYVEENIKNYIWVMLKFGVLFALIFIIWGNETVCDWLFSRIAIKELFIDTFDGVHQWTLRSGRDRYIIIYAMFAAFGYVTARKYDIAQEDADSYCLFRRRSTVFALIFSLTGASLFGIHLFVCNDRSVCNAAHAVASCIPITSYLLLRNVPTCIRTRFSSFFAWIGKMSVELFVAQYHIWLASDSQGLLVFIPNYSIVNALLTTFVFLCVVMELRNISETLSDALVTKDVRIMLRRLVIFILMLMIIWWHKNHAKKPLPS